MTEQNDLLRSSYQVALRRGQDTNWKALAENIKAELLRQAGHMTIATADEQTILRATSTPRTYRLPIIDGVVMHSYGEVEL